MKRINQHGAIRSRFLGTVVLLGQRVGVDVVTKREPADDFSQISNSEGNSSLLGEFVEFLKTNKKWWLAPILIMMLLLGTLLLLSSTAAAPFIYTLF
jgi:hypothetical protein